MDQIKFIEECIKTQGEAKVPIMQKMMTASY